MNMNDMIKNLPPGDPQLVDAIVSLMKSDGIFDELRRTSLADVDTKPAYQNLRHRVEGFVDDYLKGTQWRSDLNKNQLRDSVRRRVNDSEMLTTGVDRIVDQVVASKIHHVFLPKVTEIVHKFLGIEEEFPKSSTEPEEDIDKNKESSIPEDVIGISNSLGPVNLSNAMQIVSTACISLDDKSFDTRANSSTAVEDTKIMLSMDDEAVVNKKLTKDLKDELNKTTTVTVENIPTTADKSESEPMSALKLESVPVAAVKSESIPTTTMKSVPTADKLSKVSIKKSAIDDATKAKKISSKHLNVKRDRKSGGKTSNSEGSIKSKGEVSKKEASSSKMQKKDDEGKKLVTASKTREIEQRPSKEDFLKSSSESKDSKNKGSISKIKSTDEKTMKSTDKTVIKVKNETEKADLSSKSTGKTKFLSGSRFRSLGSKTDTNKKTLSTSSLEKRTDESKLKVHPADSSTKLKSVSKSSVEPTDNMGTDVLPFQLEDKFNSKVSGEKVSQPEMLQDGIFSSSTVTTIEKVICPAGGEDTRHSLKVEEDKKSTRHDESKSNHELTLNKIVGKVSFSDNAVNLSTGLAHYDGHRDKREVEVIIEYLLKTVEDILLSNECLKSTLDDDGPVVTEKILYVAQETEFKNIVEQERSLKAYSKSSAPSASTIDKKIEQGAIASENLSLKFDAKSTKSDPITRQSKRHPQPPVNEAALESKKSESSSLSPIPDEKSVSSKEPVKSTKLKTSRFSDKEETEKPVIENSKTKPLIIEKREPGEGGKSEVESIVDPEPGRRGSTRQRRLNPRYASDDFSSIFSKGKDRYSSDIFYEVSSVKSPSVHDLGTGTIRGRGRRSTGHSNTTEEADPLGMSPISDTSDQGDATKIPKATSGRKRKLCSPFETDIIDNSPIGHVKNPSNKEPQESSNAKAAKESNSSSKLNVEITKKSVVSVQTKLAQSIGRARRGSVGGSTSKQQNQQQLAAVDVAKLEPTELGVEASLKNKSGESNGRGRRGSASSTTSKQLSIDVNDELEFDKQTTARPSNITSTQMDSPPTTRQRIQRMESQRYDNTDLYKPRTAFLGGRRSQRRRSPAPQPAQTKSDVTATIASKRRGSNPDPEVMPPEKFHAATSGGKPRGRPRRQSSDVLAEEPSQVSERSKHVALPNVKRRCRV